MIGAVLVELIWTLPLALVVAAVASWYFIRLGGDDVPASRRRVRRLSLVAVMVTIPLLVWVLSVVDPELHPGRFIALWSVVFVMILIVVALALLDMVNNIRLHHETVRADLHDAAAELAEAMRRHRAQQKREHEDPTDQEE